MALLPIIIGLLALAPPIAVPDFLREPEYAVVKDGGRWSVRKPAVGAHGPLTVSRHPDRRLAESRRRSLPRVRLNVPYVRFDPASYKRTAIADWTEAPDAQAVALDVRDLLTRFAPPGIGGLLDTTPVYMTRLAGAAGYTAEESADCKRYVVYLDPFRATGRLHAAATLVHELTHVQRYRARGFHANRAATVLPKEDFILLGLADELDAYRAEAHLVRSFLGRQADSGVWTSARKAMRRPELNWPVALTTLLGIEGPAGRNGTLEARREVLLALAPGAGRYWDARHAGPIDPPLRQTIRDWYKTSREWMEIEAERPEWRQAQVR
jgi:hypothetical protein